MKDILIMSKNNIVASFVNEKLTIIDYALAPNYLKVTENLYSWLESRMIDTSRLNSRFLFKVLKLKNSAGIDNILASHAASVTDTYWIKEIDEEITYEKVRFDEDYFKQKLAKVYSNIALSGNGNCINYALNHSPIKTPELTNIGSYEKCWKFESNACWLYKNERQKARFSELFTHYLGCELGFNMAIYKKAGKCLKTLDFTENNKYCFEPGFSYFISDEDYINAAYKIKEINEDFLQDYINMMFLDVLVRNFDRHCFNYGILRDAESGDVVAFAPNFDNNNALISLGYDKSPKRKNDAMAESFNELLDEFPEYREGLPVVNETIIRRALNKTRMKVRKAYIIEFVLNGYNQIDK